MAASRPNRSPLNPGLVMEAFLELWRGDGEDDEQELPCLRTAMLGRERKLPAPGLKRRVRYPSEKGRRRRYHKAAQSDFMEYLQDPNASLQGTLLYDEFRMKFRLPKELFDNILDATRASGLFPDEVAYSQAYPKPRGADPQPLGVKVLGVLRYLALGIPVHAAGNCGARLGSSTM